MINFFWMIITVCVFPLSAGVFYEDVIGGPGFVRSKSLITIIGGGKCVETVELRRQAEEEKRKGVIDLLKEKYFLILFANGGDKYSKYARTIADTFSEIYGWKIRTILMDGKPLKEDPDALTLPRLAEQYGIVDAPAFLMINPDTRDGWCVGAGPLSLQNLVENIYTQAKQGENVTVVNKGKYLGIEPRKQEEEEKKRVIDLLKEKYFLTVFATREDPYSEYAVTIVEKFSKIYGWENRTVLMDEKPFNEDPYSLLQFGSLENNYGITETPTVFVVNKENGEQWCIEGVLSLQNIVEKIYQRQFQLKLKLTKKQESELNR